MIFCFAGTALFAQSEELQIWSDAYDSARTISEQLLYIQYIVDGNYPGSDVFYAKALDRLILEYPRYSTITELDAADRVALILAFRLGEAKHAASATNLWQMVNYFSNALVKAEALAAIGKTGNTMYLPHVVQLLNDLNTQSQADREMRERSERIAYGAILSLEYYREADGYLPVFFASTGWYAERIKSLASAALPKITDDPTEQLLSVVNRTGYTYAIKHLALKTSEASGSSEASKARVAVAALIEGWRLQVSDLRERQELTQMRKLALNMIRRYGTEDKAVYPQLDRSFLTGDMDEKLLVLYALEALASEDSVRLLTGYLRTIHQRRTANTITTNDEQLVRVVIPALGNVGSASRAASRAILIQIQQSPDWNYTIKNLAAQALTKIGN